MNIHQSDPGILYSDVDPDPDRSCLLPNGGNQRIAGAFYHIASASGRQEEAVSFFVCRRPGSAGNRPFPIQDQDTGKGSSGDISLHLLHDPSVQIQLIHGKIIAVRNMGIAAPVPDNRDPPGDCQRLFNVQIALLPVFPHSSIIIYPIGHIGILLDLRDQNILSDGMDGSGLDKQHISLLHWYGMQNLQKRIFLDALRKFLYADLPFKSIVQKRFLPGVHHVPHLGLSVLSFIFQGIPVVRMHLNGQVVSGIDELGQNRKIPEPPAVGTQNFFPFRINILLQRLSRISAVGNY